MPIVGSNNRDDIDPLIEDASRRHGVDPSLVRAVIQQESNFNPGAVSKAGAQGLMQLMPETGKRFGVQDAFDPKQNIEGGTQYLKSLLDRYSGDLDKALAAYNAGEAAVDQHGGIPPFPETQDYVRKVRANYGKGQIPSAMLAGHNEYDDLLGAPNEYDALLSGDPALRASLLEANQTTPDRHAQVLKLSNETRLPPEIVERNFDLISQKQQTEQNEYDALLAGTPKLTEWLRDPNNAKVSRDDLPQLSRLEQMLQFAGDAARSLGASFPAANAAVWNLLQAPADVIGATGMSERFAAYAQQQEDTAARWRPDLEKYGFVGKAALEGFEGLGEMAMLLPASLLSGQPEIAAAGFGAIAEGAWGALGFGQAYKEAKQKGLPLPQALSYAGAQGAIVGALTELPIHVLTKEFAANSGFLKTALRELKTAIPTMQAQTLLSDLDRWSQINPDQTVGQFLAERPEAAANTLIATMVGVIGQAALSRGLSRITKPFLKDLGDAVKESKTGQRLPAKLQEFLEHAGKDGPVENVYIPAEDAQQYFQDKKLNPSEVLGPEGAARYQEALQANEDIKIPLSEYATRIAPSEHAGFFNDVVRLGSPEQMNAREEKAFAERANDEAIQRNMERADQDERLDESARKVGEDIRGSLTGTGFPANVVDAYAKVYERGFRAMALAKDTGETPEQLYEPYRLKITRPLPEILRSLPDVDTQLDPLIDRLRSGKVPTGEEMFGKSLVDFLREKGGLKDEGGELSSRQPDAERKPFEKRLLNKKGLDLDRARELAAEAGYLPKESSVADFLDAIDKETRGEPVYSQSEHNPQVIEQKLILDQLNQYLKSRDVDIRTASNAEIKKVLKEAASLPVIDAASGQLLAQPDHQRINERNTLHHDTSLEAAESILKDGAILPKAYQEKFLGWGKETRPSVAAERVGFTKPVTSFSRMQRTERGFITFEVDPAYVRESRPVQGLSQDLKWEGKFEAETATEHPVPAEGIKNILINRPRVDARYGVAEANERIARIKALAEQRGIPVIEGSKEELLQRRVRGGGENTTYDQSSVRRFADLIQKRRGAEGLQAAVLGNSGTIYTGSWHGEAIDKAHDANDFSPRTTAEAPESRQGFLTKDGRFLTREEVDKEFGVKFSEDIPGRFDEDVVRLGETIRYSQTTLDLEKRGTIHFGPNREFSISLLQNADLSTFLHETGHFYFEVFGDIVDDLKGRGELNDTQQRMVDDYNTLLKWVGVESRDQIQTEHHEQIARGFEAYLREGKAPSPELRPIFQRFKAWLTQIYKSLTQLNVHLNDDVRGVFDRLLASDDEITRAREDANIREMIENQGQAERLGLSPEEYRAYGNTVRQARDRAKDALDRQYLDELTKKQSDWYQARTKTVRDQIAAEVQGQRDYMALSFLKDGKLPDGSPLPEGVQAVKLDAAALEDRYGKHKDSSVMQQLRKLDLYRKEGGIDPDQAADLFGYSSGDEMIQALLKLRPMDQLIEAETTDRMRQSYGDMLTDGTAPEKARDAVMTEGRSKVLEAEMKALAKKVRETAPFRQLGASEAKRADRQQRQAGLDTIRRFVPSVALARDIATQRISEMRVRDVKANLHYSAARREGNAALEAVNRGDFQDALKHKQNELVQVEMYRAATETAKEIEKIRDSMRSFDDPKKRGRIGKAGEGYLDQIDKLRERFEFSRQTNKALDKRSSLADFIKSEEALGHELAIPQELQNEARQQNYRDMTVEQLRGLHDAVKTIEHWANFKNKLLRQAAKRELDALAADGQASIDKNRKGPPREIPINPDLPGKDPARVLRWMDLGHRPLQAILRELDGYNDGFFFENVYRPAAEARDAEGVMGREADQKYGLIYDEAFKGKEAALHQTTFLPELGKPVDKTMALAVALNSGNDGNRERLHSAGIGNIGPLNDTQIRAITDTLDAKDWKYVQEVAKLINSYKEPIGALYKRVTGVEPEWVEPKPFQTKFGEMPGWYYPIMYSGKASARALPGPEASFADIVTKSSYMRFQTANGHTEARTETTGIPLRGDLGVIGQHLQQVIHDLTHREMLTDVGRILGRKEIQDAIYKNYGDQYYRSIQSAFRDVAIGPTPPPDWYRSTFSVLRRNYGMARLAWNFGTIVRHITNITNGMVRVGPVDVTQAIFQSMQSAKGEELSRQWIMDNVDFMRARWNHRMEETARIGNDIRANRGPWAAWMRDHAATLGIDPDLTHHIADTFLYGIHKVIEKAENPTWIAAYRQAVDAGRPHEDAVASANAAIADAFGNGDIVDLPSVQRDYVGKLFSTFMQYGLSLYRQNYEIYHKAAPLTRKAVDAMLINIVPTVLLSGIFAYAYGKKYWDELKNEQFDHLMSQSVFARELMGALRSPDYQGPAAFGPVGVMKRLIYQTYRAIEAESGQKGWKAFETGLEAGGQVLGIPAPQIEKSVEGLWSLWEGKTHNPSALLFGPPKK